MIATDSARLSLNFATEPELEPHADLRQELLTRRLKAVVDDARPAIPSEKIFDELRKKFEKPLPEPAVWQKQL